MKYPMAFALALLGLVATTAYADCPEISGNYKVFAEPQGGLEGGPHQRRTG